MLSEQDITAIRTRAGREWKASHQLQAKRVGKAAAPLNSGDVLALLTAYEEKERQLAHWTGLCGGLVNEREAAVADAARSLAAMREAEDRSAMLLKSQHDVSNKLQRAHCLLGATRDMLLDIRWRWWPVSLLWPRFNAVLATLRAEQKEEEP